jgi:hypothetical protein
MVVRDYESAMDVKIFLRLNLKVLYGLLLLTLLISKVKFKVSLSASVLFQLPTVTLSQTAAWRA